MVNKDVKTLTVPTTKKRAIKLSIDTCTMIGGITAKTLTSTIYFKTPLTNIETGNFIMSFSKYSRTHNWMRNMENCTIYET